jgi:hypothetical protein
VSRISRLRAGGLTEDGGRRTQAASRPCALEASRSIGFTEQPHGDRQAFASHFPKSQHVLQDLVLEVLGRLSDSFCTCT